MGMFHQGKWGENRGQHDEDGRFMRGRTAFRRWITDDGSSWFPAEAGRYHLYVSLACPWAHRTLIVRKLRKLEEAVSLSVVDFLLGEEGWEFSDNPGAIPDTVNKKKRLREIYLMADPEFTGRVTVPVLWDKQEKTIVNNESREIIRMFDTVFGPIGDPEVNFWPEGLREQVDDTLDRIYEPINNGVYRCGFAGSQKAYDEAARELFEALEHWEGVLEKQRYLCGEVLTEADWCLFTTLVRFDAVYHTHFKCNLRRISDYPNLGNYLKELYQVPGVADTVNLEHIKGHYYRSHTSINPKGIVPVGMPYGLDTPHDRDRKFPR